MQIVKEGVMLNRTPCTLKALNKASAQKGSSEGKQRVMRQHCAHTVQGSWLSILFALEFTMVTILPRRVLRYKAFS
jgi:hypothetical protein